MLQLEIPHVNVLSKMDLITQYGELRASPSVSSGTLSVDPLGLSYSIQPRILHRSARPVVPRIVAGDRTIRQEIRRVESRDLWAYRRLQLGQL